MEPTWGHDDQPVDLWTDHLRGPLFLVTLFAGVDEQHLLIDLTGSSLDGADE